MNTPNKLTMLRVIMVPIFIWAITSGFYIVSIIVFALASLTDQLDGYIARKNNQVTTFGKLMDPLADKILTISALICFLEIGADFINSWVVMIIIARELIVTGIRQLAMGENTVIAASQWGKAKTVSQMVAIIAVMLDLIVPLRWGGFCLTLWLIALAVILTVYSGVDYIVKNRHLITFK
ncbi:MAG: CDP-diacylglycerol--glycerol-3-phosphate 3-phosphatidyltransferase [Clostridia bacterium]|nr:CDP-diacylglycerol--glycerol-3-phosphate 3-phosphatidyltransferase [Clostridia bacterium]